MTPYGVIYIATNIATGEQYVGQTIRPPHVRFYAHKISAMNPKSRFHKAIADYGFEAFTFEVVVSALSREGLNAAEKQLISDYKSTYNSTSGGSGKPGPVAQATRDKLAAKAKQRWADPEWRTRTEKTLRDLAARGVFTESGRKGGSTGCGARARWAGHEKKLRQLGNRSASMVASWKDQDVRERRLIGLREANMREGAAERRSLASRGRKMPKSAIAASARAKWKPVYCPELQISFLSRTAAAEYIGVGKTTVCEAMRRNSKVAGMYTLKEVYHRLQ